MHYEVPPDAASFSDLKNLEPRCERGCYRCLLSYYNQTEHEYINRQDKKVVELLLACASGQVKLAKPSDTVESTGVLGAWMSKLTELGLRHPESREVVLTGFDRKVDAMYATQRVAVLIGEAPADAVNYLQGKGLTVITFPEDPATWPAIFSEHAQYFKIKP